MEILLPSELAEWIRIDSDQDSATLDMLEASAIDLVEYWTGQRLRSVDDPITGLTLPGLDPIPASLKHALALLIHAHYDDRTGSVDAATIAAKRLCAPYWRAHL